MAKRTVSRLAFVLLFNIVRLDSSCRRRALSVRVRYNLNRMRRRVVDDKLVWGFAG